MNINLTKKSTREQKTLNKVIKINEAKIQSHLDTMVRKTVEQTINDLLDTEADHLCTQRLLYLWTSRVAFVKEVLRA